jgi:hypothetical protein
MHKVNIIEQQEGKVIGSVFVKNGRAVASDRKIGALVGDIYLPRSADDPTPAELSDGEGFLDALVFGLRGGVIAVPA